MTPDDIMKAYNDKYIKSSFILDDSYGLIYEAVEAVYQYGYITEDEAKELLSKRLAQRNECTNILLTSLKDSINIYCIENIDYVNIEILFDIEYDRLTGVIKVLS